MEMKAEINTKKKQMYEMLLKQQEELILGEDHWISILANSSALLNETLNHSIFTGYYLFDGEKLFLGPFQGRLSCTIISLGQGVCGEAAETGKTIIVDDVAVHDNYISCDSAAMSEIVVPMYKEDQLLGVLDIDSGETSEYDDMDQRYLEQYVKIIVKSHK